MARLLQLEEEPPAPDSRVRFSCIACGGKGKVRKNNGTVGWRICDGCGGEGWVWTGPAPTAREMIEQIAPGRVMPAPTPSAAVRAAAPVSASPPDVVRTPPAGMMNVRMPNGWYEFRRIESVDTSDHGGVFGNRGGLPGIARQNPELREGERVVWLLGTDIPDIVLERIERRPTSAPPWLSPTPTRPGWMQVRVNGEVHLRRVASQERAGTAADGYLRNVPYIADGECIDWGTPDGIPRILPTALPSRFNPDKMR